MDVFMLKNCTSSTPDTRKQPYVYDGEWSLLLLFFFHKLKKDKKIKDKNKR